MIHETRQMYFPHSFWENVMRSFQPQEDERPLNIHSMDPAQFISIEQSNHIHRFVAGTPVLRLYVTRRSMLHIMKTTWMKTLPTHPRLEYGFLTN